MSLEDIALCFTPGLGPKGALHLIEYFGSAQRVFSSSLAELTKGARLRQNIAEAIVAKVGFTPAKREMEYCKRHNITPIAATDDEYPPLLREIPDRPHVIYVMGNVAALSRRAISVVGTRRISSYGQIQCSEFVKQMGETSPDAVIVSGLAFGVDSEAHRTALHHGRTTVAVIANPLPGVTPAQHANLAREIIAQGGAIVSEYHSQTKQCANLYIARNRIIAGISEATLLVESPLSGGSMATARIANDYNRMVFAIPGRITDNNSIGCNHLIATNQATLYYSTEQVARQLMWDINAPSDRAAVARNEPELRADQRGLMECFRTEEPLAIEELAALTALDVSALSAMLLELELLGIVRSLPGNRYLPLESYSTK